MTAAAIARSALFVPGNRPDRFAKAHAAAPDLVILDLEDAVTADAKTAARDAVAAALPDALANGLPVAVRINATGSAHFEADLEVVRRHACPIVLPKAADPTTIARIAAENPVVALIETAAGVLAAPAIAATPGVVRLALGHLDLAAEIDVDPDDREALRAVRTALVLASAAAGIAAPVDGVTAEVKDVERLRDDVAYARRLGMAGKLCVHPAQVAPTTAALRPDPATLAWARRVVEAAGSEAVALLDGRMVDAPVVLRAQRVLTLADDERIDHEPTSDRHHV